jgi:hypothetical protein
MHGLDVSGLYSYPLDRFVPSSVTLGPDIGHLCFGDDEEFFPGGVPVLGGSIKVQQWGSYWWKVTLECPAYWTQPILLLHERTEPAQNWRLLNFFEAAALLCMYPKLGSVRYYSPNATAGRAEIFVYDRRVYVSCGTTPRGHHAAYTTGPGGVSLLETRF